MSLNKEQELAIQCVKEKKNLFITSQGAGCGKTFLLNVIIDKFGSFWGFNKNVAVTATTGVAALLLKGGRTINSWASICKGESSVETLYKNSMKSNAKIRWKKVDILIIDEISLMSPSLFDKLEELARLARNNDKPFGGIQLIVSGDWLQLPTINNSGYAFQSNTWNKCIHETIYLKQIMRQKDPLFQRVLNSIRVGDINDEVKRVLLSRVNKTFDHTKGIIPTKLFCINSDIDRINSNELYKLSRMGHIIKYYPIQWSSKSSDNLKYNKYLKNCNLVEKLELTIGCQVMLLTNLSVEDELVNGSRGVVDSFNLNGKPNVKFLNNMIIEIDYKNCDIEIDNKIIGTFKQIPLKLAYASSIHKMQGSTLDSVILNLENVFEVSQGYVGLSRVKDLKSLYIENINFDKLTVNSDALEFYINLDNKKNSEINH
tara:strand:- start:175 stop:1464 length:1290 start_codon:yes stop_codon:yes gene_type:complete